MDKMTLLTTLHLLGFKKTSNIDDGSYEIDVSFYAEPEQPCVVEYCLGSRYEICVSISGDDEELHIRVWVMDFSAKSSLGYSYVALLTDEAHVDYETAKNRVVDLVDRLVRAVESPTTVSNLEMGKILNT